MRLGIWPPIFGKMGMWRVLAMYLKKYPRFMSH